VECEHLTHLIIGAAMEVHRAVGPGFLESVYKKALLHELQLRGLSTNVELELLVKYKDLIVGRHRVDMVIADRIIVELKAMSGITDIHIAQALSYMKASGLEIALIINFGEESLVWKRLVRSRGLRGFTGF
jgi:GxxExxY protein